jgi:hypothetical protein
MEINVKRAGVVDFSEIKVGELFYCNDTCMKIREFKDDKGVSYNAINLEHTEFQHFDACNSVWKVRGSLNIEIV